MSEPHGHYTHADDRRAFRQKERHRGWKRAMKIATVLSTVITVLGLLLGGPAHWRLRSLQSLYTDDWPNLDLAPIGTHWQHDPNILVRNTAHSTSDGLRSDFYTVSFAMVVEDQNGKPRLLRTTAFRSAHGVNRFVEVRVYLSTASWVEHHRAEQTPQLPTPRLIAGSPGQQSVLTASDAHANSWDLQASLPFHELEQILSSDPVELEWFEATVVFTPEQLDGLRRMMRATREFRR